MSVPERVRDLVEPIVADAGLELFDLELAGGVLRVTIDRPGGLDMQAIAATTRAVSRALDEADPIDNRYTLEVSSPGLERPLRTPAHFRWAIGREVTIKTVSTYDGPRRLTGTLVDAGDDHIGVTLDDPAGDTVELAYHDIERARTVFRWGPTPKPNDTTTRTKRVKAT